MCEVVRCHVQEVLNCAPAGAPFLATWELVAGAFGLSQAVIFSHLHLRNPIAPKRWGLPNETSPQVGRGQCHSQPPLIAMIQAITPKPIIVVSLQIRSDFLADCAASSSALRWRRSVSSRSTQISSP